MIHFIREDFSKDHLYAIANVKHCDYYVKMAVAWYFATALTYRYDETVSFLEENPLDKWCHNKAISKACDSLQITKEKKDHLKALRLN